MSKNYTIVIQFVFPLAMFYQSGAQNSAAYEQEVSVTSWRFHNQAWQPQCHDRLSETAETLWIHKGALPNQQWSLAMGCGINNDHVYLDQNCSLQNKGWPADPDRQNLSRSDRLSLFTIYILAKLCFGPASFRSYFEDWNWIACHELPGKR